MSQVPILSGIPAATGGGLSEETGPWWRPGGLIFGLIRVRSSMFIGIQIDAAMQVTNVSVIPRTIIPTPENRKVGGSTPPLATHRYPCPMASAGASSYQ